MPGLTASALRQEIAAGTTTSLYMLVGEDNEEKAAVAAEFADLVEEGLRAFNVDRLHGGDVSVPDLVHAASTFPMMAPRRVVLVLEAERLMIPKREGKAADEELERLEAFISDPPSHATVVFVCGDIDRRRRVPKLLDKLAKVVDCGTIEDVEAAERWVRARAASEGMSMDAGAARTLAERVGADIVRLRAGLERVRLYAMGQASIRSADVLEAVSPGNEAGENFGITNAIEHDDAAAALRQLSVALDAGVSPFMVLGQIRWMAGNKLASPRVRGAVEAIFRTDRALKSSGGDPRILLERLVVELCGAPGSRRPTAWRPRPAR